ncbi:MAG: PAS domain-containing protein [Oceanicaulis sp.]|uniref:sensor histidine kinase n=1 Tax=Glycocaulis sp. TaxID=1969725 RepID=UPI0025BF43B0|nr:PAS domain-containing sensor histidine kinase [Glycocaulis sp.]MCC5982155.1 PAS domain-containing protein [Oceanicaulis sp.]MCH8522127.1 PAS domain-containing sensor histidine kinase [Glycocaulis sp.]
MQAILARLGAGLNRALPRLIHAGWAAGVVVLAGIVLFSAEPGLAAIAVLLAAALPGLAGLRLAASGQWSDLTRLTLVVCWTVPGISAVLLTGGVMGPQALVFLAGPAAFLASRQAGAALISLLAHMAAFAVLAFGAGVSAPLMADGAATGPVWALLAAYLSVCSLIGWAAIVPALSRSRKEAARLRRRAEGFEAAPAALIVCGRDGRMHAASEAARALVPGLPRALEGLPFADLAFDEDGRELLQGHLAHARGSLITEVRGPGGQPVRVEASAHAAPSGHVIMLREPQAGRAVIDRLARERDEAIAASKAKSEFLAAISHELRTPLNAIIGFSDLMKQRLFGPMPARYAEYADLIHESGNHLLDLIGDVLDMSRIEADRYELVREDFDAGEVIETCVRMMRLRAEDKAITLSVDSGADEMPVHADRKALRQIVLNLLSNAIKFTPEGGAVVVMVRASGNDLVVAVGDSGPGLSAEDAARLGQPYAQARTARQSEERGSGLGLALVHALAGMHGGSMSLKSTLGEGTTVNVRMPVLRTAGEAAGDVAVLPVVHEQIRRAQEAGEAIAQQAAS